MTDLHDVFLGRGRWMRMGMMPFPPVCLPRWKREITSTTSILTPCSVIVSTVSGACRGVTADQCPVCHQVEVRGDRPADRADATEEDPDKENRSDRRQQADSADPAVVYEVTSADGFKFRSPDIAEVSQNSGRG